MLAYKWDRELFRQLVKTANTTNDDLANKIGVSKEAFQYYLKGKSTPSFTALLKIADYFCIPIDVLIGRCSSETYISVANNFASSFNELRTRAYTDYLYTKNSNLMYSNLPSDDNVAAPWPYNLLDILIHDRWSTVLTDDQQAGFDYAFSKLTDRERRWLTLYFRDEKTMKQIGQEAGVTVSRVQQVITKAIRKLRHPFRFNYILNGFEGNKTRDEIICRTQEKERLEKDIARLSSVLDNLRSEYGDVIKEYEEKLAKDPHDIIDDLDLGIRSYNCLRRANLNTIDDIHNAIITGRFIKIRNFGRKSAEEVLRALQTKFKVDYFPEYYELLGKGK